MRFYEQNNEELLKQLLQLNLFPIKDSYIAYLRKDKTAISRNPQTVNRISGRLYEMGLDIIFARCTEPKETNRQIGPLFKRWINKGVLGIQPVTIDEFTATNDNAILNGSDAQLMEFSRNYLNYNHNKGLDFIARFNGKYVIRRSEIYN